MMMLLLMDYLRQCVFHRTRNQTDKALALLAALFSAVALARLGLVLALVCLVNLTLALALARMGLFLFLVFQVVAHAVALFFAFVFFLILIPELARVGILAMVGGSLLFCWRFNI